MREDIESLITVNIDTLQYNEQPSISIINARNIKNIEIELFSLGDCVAYLHTSSQPKLINDI